MRIYLDDFAIDTLSRRIKENIENVQNEIVVVGIGTDKCTGDSLGPLTGTFLKELGAKFPVYGIVGDTVNAANLEDMIKRIGELHPDAFVIAVDAALGEAGHVGSITFKKEPLKPGSGLKKEIPSIGNISIAGIVNMSGWKDFMAIQTTSLGIVYKMAKTIASAIMVALAGR